MNWGSWQEPIKSMFETASEALTGGKATESMEMNTPTLHNAEVTGNVKSSVFTLTSTPTIELDPANGVTQLLHLTQNTAVSLASTFEVGQTVELVITNLSHSVTWPSSVTWVNGSVPSFPFTGTKYVAFKKISDSVTLGFEI